MRSLTARSSRALETVALVGIGGFAGSNLRYEIAKLGSDLPATLAVNAIGSFLLGVVIYAALRTDRLSMETRLLVSTGFLSSFTTYSTFALQAIRSRPPVLVGYFLLSYGLGFTGVLVGRHAVSRVLGEDP